MALSLDQVRIQDHDELYSEGQTIELTPHKAPKPWGWKWYPMPPDLTSDDIRQTDESKRIPRMQQVFQDKPHNLDLEIQKDAMRKMKVEVLEVLSVNNRSGSFIPGTQKIKCRVLEVPSVISSADLQQTPVIGDVIFLKVYDALFWPHHVNSVNSYIRLTARADMAMSDEVGAYQTLYNAGLTGPSSVAPQWLGCWTAEVPTTDPSFQGQTRFVGVIALEFLDAICLKDLWVTKQFRKPIYLGDSSKLTKDGREIIEGQLDRATRLGTIEDLLDGIVKQYKVNVTHEIIHPENVLISLRGGGGSRNLTRPRVSLVGYKNSVVGSFREPPQDVFAKWPNPPHPFRRFNTQILGHFLKYMDPKWKVNDPETVLAVDKWLLKTFGSLDGDKYTSFVCGEASPPIKL
ncbi:hypothetical protein CkaCkLH20_02919 [Colletotrichum karsti]|uniref:Uncharacterized protein n=1 Tax=Colletotrichum karsti TaxID=1095194 RepID=A0A9P6LNM4_9PEZI|nr:uncharacterized protein CkaCkLH20_02919 [Colletotrichum karsti]KAF9879376.1 hypothetical protein CkaCkLH20_02919 [Colletotrichum karsti]